MRDDLLLKILSPTKVVFTGIIFSVSIPSYLGEMQIYSKHSSLVSSLLPGYITVFHASDKQDKYFSNGGYVEVNKNQITLILDDIFETSDITKDFLQNKIDELSPKLNHLYNDDYAFDKISQSIASYKQYLSY
jgi:F-type H+-transporting ATPase subunit epsilon